MNECREAFEKWAVADGWPVNRADEYPEYYACGPTQVRWYTWQAAWDYKEKSDEA